MYSKNQNQKKRGRNKTDSILISNFNGIYPFDLLKKNVVHSIRTMSKKKVRFLGIIFFYDCLFVCLLKFTKIRNGRSYDTSLYI